MRQTFEIPGRFCSFNDYDKMNWPERRKLKKDYDMLVAVSAKAAKVKPCRGRIRYHVLWIEENRQRDLDNVAFAKKFIQDGLVKAGILHNDTHHEIAGFSDDFAYDPRNPRIIVELEEI